MTEEKTRIGIIGVGQIGKGHVRTYMGMPHVEIAAVADVNEAEANRVAAENGIAKVYTDFRQLLARDDIAAVDVCLHNNFHMPATVAALEAGKHVFCEKPMAGAYIDAEKMLATARECGLMLSIQNREYFIDETKGGQIADRRRLSGQAVSCALNRLSTARPALRGRLRIPFLRE